MSQVRQVARYVDFVRMCVIKKLDTVVRIVAIYKKKSPTAGCLVVCVFVEVLDPLEAYFTVGIAIALMADAAIAK